MVMTLKHRHSLLSGCYQMSQNWKIPDYEVHLMVFISYRDIVFHEFCPQGAPVSKQYCLSSLCYVHEVTCKKWPDLQNNLQKFYHNNTSYTSLFVQQFLTKNNITGQNDSANITFTRYGLTWLCCLLKTKKRNMQERFGTFQNVNKNRWIRWRLYHKVHSRKNIDISVLHLIEITFK